MGFKDDIPSAAEEAKKGVEPFRDNDLIMTGDVMYSWMANYLSQSAFNMICADPEWLNKSVSLSNMAGPRAQRWKFGGKEAHWVTMTTCHEVPEITFTSMYDTCKVTVSGDAAKFKDFKLLT